MRTFRRTIAGAVLLVLLLLDVPLATPADAALSCGSTIVASMTLENDVGPCPGDGIVIGASNVTLDLGGHTVLGSGLGSTGLGIQANGLSGVVIKGPGTVQGFRVGISVTESQRLTVEAVNVLRNGLPRPAIDFDPNDGIRIVMSTLVTVRANTAVGNGDDGVSLISTVRSSVLRNRLVDNGHNGMRLDASDQNQILDNTIHSNGDLVGFPRGCGIEAFGSRDNVISRNRVNENDTGIRLRPQANPPRASTGNVIEQNITTRSRAPQADRGGINLQGASTSGNEVRANQIAENANGITLTAGPVGNRFFANALRRNTCAIKGTVAGNVFSGNTFQGNASTFCP